MKTISRISAVVAMSLSAVSFAADSQWELFTGGFANVDITTQAASTTTYGIVGATKVKPTLAYSLGSGLQVALQPSLTGTSAGGSMNFEALVGVYYNFMGAMDDAMFVKGLVGLESVASTSTFEWTVGVGKRFKVVDHVTFAPELDFNMTMYTGTARTVFAIVPVQFSLQM